MKLTEYLKETRNEMSHVTWPSRRQTIAYSSLVIAYLSPWPRSSALSTISSRTY